MSTARYNPNIEVFGHRLRTGSQRRFVVVREGNDRLVIERRSDSLDVAVKAAKVIRDRNFRERLAVWDQADGKVAWITQPG